MVPAKNSIGIPALRLSRAFLVPFPGVVVVAIPPELRAVKTKAAINLVIHPVT